MTVDDADARVSSGPRGLGIAGAVGALLLLVIAALAVLDQSPPTAVRADAPASEFSAERAHQQIVRFATAPHPVGTPEHERVRDYLVGQLRALGLQPQVDDAVGVVPAGIGQVAGLIPVARTRNIVTVIKGTAPTGRLMLSAHYDSVPSGPGANDDGAGVSTILEVARALTTGLPPRNDIVLLITDAEEPGLLGAEAYTHSRPRGETPAIVLNHESRGTSGAVQMFRSTGGSAALTRLFADVAPHPVADSTSSTLFGLMPNGTDFTAFSADGYKAMDFAYLEGGAHYHSIRDAAAFVDQRSLQQMGANALAMTRALGTADLAEYTRPQGDEVYFNVPPGLFVHFPTAWAWVLVALAVLLAVVAVVLVVRAGEATVRRLVWAVIAVGVLMGAGGLAGLGYWGVLWLIRPDLASFPSPWRPLALQAGVLAIAVVVLGVWYPLVRRLGTWALWAAAVIVLTVLGVAGVVVAPQLAPILVPAPFAALGGILALRTSNRVGRAVALTIGLVPTAVMLIAVGWTTFSIGLRDGLYLAVPPMMLAAVLMLPLVAAPQIRWRRLLSLPAAAALLAIVLAVVGLRMNTPGATRPSPARLVYALDADTGRASWAVPSGKLEWTKLDPWTQRLVGSQTVDNPAPDPTLPRARVGPAPVVTVPAPTLQILGDTTVGGIRTVRLSLASPRGAEGLVLAVDDRDGRVTAIRAAGRDVPVKPEEGKVGVHLYAMSGPVEVDLDFRAGAPLPVTLADVDQLASALAAVPGYQPPPDRLYLRYSWFTVITTHRL
ncbi:M20/M25/M40 family metallo-hydrolase [Gordonia sp. (in: high G+C Gram-positive bacteria)]|uniref:M20/M25/M40 family metallo-hydrolase n=1 Tax=Gordonia sp. (in: high G+C Gram-positive bacteria) TaxID=84139 RepID=UPI0039E69EE8